MEEGSSDPSYVRGCDACNFSQEWEIIINDWANNNWNKVILLKVNQSVTVCYMPNHFLLVNPLTLSHFTSVRANSFAELIYWIIPDVEVIISE